MSSKVQLTIGGEDIYPITDASVVAGLDSAIDERAVSTVSYDTTNKKITKTKNGTTTDVVAASTLVTDGGGIKNVKTVNNNSLVGTGNVSVGTITGITMNGSSKGTSGVVDLGTVITSHQSIKTVNNNTLTGTGNVSVGTITGITMNGTSKGTSGVVDLGTVITSHQDISGKLDKTTYEWNKEIAFGQSGKLLIGKFPCYDSNVTISINSTTSNTYHAVAIMATQNINTSGGGTINWNTYGDSANTVTPNLYAKYASGSNVIEIYFSPTTYSKNLIHIQCNRLPAAPTNICESVSEIPAAATRKPTNTLTDIIPTESTVSGWGFTKNTGTVTSVSAGTGLSISGTASVNPTVNVASGYKLPTTTEWNAKAPLASPALTGTPTAPTATSGTNTTQIATTAFVKTAIDNLPEPMIFKGSLGTGGTITSLPAASSSNEGYTYKVITAGTYASQAAKVGDIFISTGSEWVLIPSGDEPSGTVTSIAISATSPIAIDNSAAITTSGTRTISHANSGVTAGTYRSVTVNATGHVTAGSNPTTISGYGITDAKIASGTITLGSNTITPVTGPSSSTANHIATFSDATGKVIKDSGYTIATSVPSGAVFTDTKVTQQNSTANSTLNVLLKYDTGTSTTTNVVNSSSSLNFNPSTGLLTTTDIRVSGKDVYVGSASGSQCHQQYDSTNKCLKFIFD